MTTTAAIPTRFRALLAATVLATAYERHAGVASGVNNAVARVANLLAVAALPVIAGVTGEGLFDPAQMTDGFHIAIAACAALATIGGVTAWHEISRDALEPEPARLGRERRPLPTTFSCDVAGRPLRPAAERTAALGR